MILPYRTTKEKYTSNYIEVMNCFFGLTDKQIEVLSFFVNKYLSLKDVLHDNRIIWKQVFHVDNKHQCAISTNLRNKNNVEQYIKIFKEKKVLSKKNGYWEINKLIIPNGETDVTFRFILLASPTE